MGDPEKPPRLKATIFKEFIDHYDTINNVIYLHSNEMRTFPRQHIKEETLQFDMDRFASEVRKVLKRGKKRGFAFVGIPGTGKSTIIRKLESVVTEYPIVYATQSNFMSEYDIAETFMTMSYLQPCIVILEDLDSYDLKDKKRNLGVFLDCIDDVNNRLNVVFLATINDTSLVHYSLINRPGRLDQVIMVKAPQNKEDVYKVMQTRYLKNIGEDSGNKKFMPIEDIDESLMDQILSMEYTQADICEIIEKALLLSDDIANETLLKSLKELEESKRAIERCNFKGQDPTLGKDLEISNGKPSVRINRPLIR
jgi:SpoVK/Ycf46/Vps4 family AAA+-type ATPase